MGKPTFIRTLELEPHYLIHFAVIISIHEALFINLHGFRERFYRLNNHREETHITLLVLTIFLV